MIAGFVSGLYADATGGFGFWAMICGAAGTYMGSLIETLDLFGLEECFTNYAVTLLVGTTTEIVSVTTQNAATGNLTAYSTNGNQAATAPVSSAGPSGSGSLGAAFSGTGCKGAVFYKIAY